MRVAVQALLNRYTSKHDRTVTAVTAWCTAKLTDRSDPSVSEALQSIIDSLNGSSEAGPASEPLMTAVAELLLQSSVPLPVERVTDLSSAVKTLDWCAPNVVLTDRVLGRTLDLVPGGLTYLNTVSGTALRADLADIAGYGPDRVGHPKLAALCAADNDVHTSKLPYTPALPARCDLDSLQAANEILNHIDMVWSAALHPLLCSAMTSQERDQLTETMHRSGVAVALTPLVMPNVHTLGHLLNEHLWGSGRKRCSGEVRRLLEPVAHALAVSRRGDCTGDAYGHYRLAQRVKHGRTSPGYPLTLPVRDVV